MSRRDLATHFLLAFVVAAGFGPARPAGADIGEGSCIGTDACYQGPFNVGTDSCVGEEACYQGPHTVGNSTCVGDQSCLQFSGAIGDDSCNGSKSCLQGDGGIGDASCNGDQACVQMQASVGNYSCNGPEACYQVTGSVGDCQNNTVRVLECEAPVCGDVNQSGSVTASDALGVLKKSVGQPIALVCAVCGDGVIYGTERCEAGDLDGQTCATLGFAGGTLACGAGCTFDTSACYAARVDASGSTIIDHATGLEWEKKDGKDGELNFDNPHDVDNYYFWCAGAEDTCELASNPLNGTVATQFLANLNGGNTGDCYGGYCDWRVPTIDELATIVVLAPGCTAAPCVVDPAFLPLDLYYNWSSTTSPDPSLAYLFEFNAGTLAVGPKAQGFSVRAVRGGVQLH